MTTPFLRNSLKLTSFYLLSFFPFSFLLLILSSFFLSALLRSNKHFGVDARCNTQFSVKHYASTVTYNIEGFMEKNTGEKEKKFEYTLEMRLFLCIS